jgi:hypothetical protein
MQLSIRRSQRDAGMLGSKVVFAIDARIHPTAEEAALIKRYKLGKELVYSSENARRHADAAEDGARRGSVGGTAKALISLGLNKLSLNCTIDSLCAGQRIECKDLVELLAAEEAVIEACSNAKTFLDAASTFDGRELVMEF